MTRGLVWTLLLLAFAGAACSNDDTSLERRGGPLPEAMPDPPSSMAGGAGAGGASGDGIAFCDALQVIQAKCQRCHNDPQQNGAPVAFLTYEDTQANYFETERKWFEVMLEAVSEDFMPFVALNKPPTSLMPPVEPLTVEEKATLLGWLKQGALPEGGTDCP